MLPASFLILLIPAVYTWWHGRALLRRLDDPLFAELHVRKAHRVGSVLGICLGISLVLSYQHLGLKVLLGLLGTTAADYRFRRAVFAETWGFLSYVAHGLRFAVANLGVWILVALMPDLIHMADSARVPVAIALATVAVVASQLYSHLFRWLMGGRAIPDPDLAARFARVLAKASCKTPWIAHAGPAGGFWINALAVPSLYRSGVVLSNDLLASLGPREATAIFAHEVGHLEQFRRGRLLAGNLVLLIFVALAVVLALQLGPDSRASSIAASVWPLVVLLWLSLAARHNQKREHEGDLRAVELCEDAQALIDGLTKVHVLGRLPRRWEARHEAGMTHPSLAQRLRAIREAAGIEQPKVAALGVRAADGGDRAVVLATDRIFWLAGVPPEGDKWKISPEGDKWKISPEGDKWKMLTPGGRNTDPAALCQAASDRRSILYTDLTDLRLAAGGLNTRQLVATDRRGSSMRLAVRTEDVPAVKATLARIDVLLPGTAPGVSRSATAASTGNAWVRVDAVLLMILGLLPPSSGTLSLASLLVLIRPAQATLAAAGSIAVAAALLGLPTLESPILEQQGTLMRLGALTFFGLYFLAFAGRRFRARLEEPAWTLWVGLGLMGGFATLSAGLGLSRLIQPLPAMQIHLWARQIPAFALLATGIAAMLLTVRHWWARLASVLLVLSVAAVAVLADLGFRDRFGDDPFAAGTPSLASETWDLEKVRELETEDYVTQLILSPSGGRLAYFRAYSDPGDVADPDSAGSESPGFQIEQADGGFVNVEAMALEFLDDERLVVLAFDDDQAMVLRILEPAPDQPAPEPAPDQPAPEPAPEMKIAIETTLPKLLAPNLRVHPELDRWQVAGNTDDGSEVLLLTGDLSGALLSTDRYPVSETDWFAATALVDSSGRLLRVDQQFAFGNSPKSFWLGMLWSFMSGAATTSEIETLEPTGPRTLARTTSTVQCFDPAPGSSEFLCTAGKATTLPFWMLEAEGTTDLWLFDAESGRLIAVGSVPESYYQALIADDGRILLSSFDSPPVVVDPATATVMAVGRRIATEPALSARLREAAQNLGNDSGDDTPESLLFLYVAPSFAFRASHLGVAVAGDDGSTILVYRLP